MRYPLTMRLFDFRPPNRSMTREQWKVADRWIRTVSRRILPVALECAEQAMICGSSGIVLEDGGEPRVIVPDEFAIRLKR